MYVVIPPEIGVGFDVLPHRVYDLSLFHEPLSRDPTEANLQDFGVQRATFVE